MPAGILSLGFKLNSREQYSYCLCIYKQHQVNLVSKIEN